MGTIAAVRNGERSGPLRLGFLTVARGLGEVHGSAGAATGPQFTDAEVSVLVSQYEQSCADVRDHRTRSWQLLVSSALVNAALLALDLQALAARLNVGTQEAVTWATISGMALVSVVLLVQAYKERFFEIVGSKYAFAIQGLVPAARDLRFKTSEILAQLNGGGLVRWDEGGFFRRGRLVFRPSAWKLLALSLMLLPAVTGLATAFAAALTLYPHCSISDGLRRLIQLGNTSC